MKPGFGPSWHGFTDAGHFTPAVPAAPGALALDLVAVAAGRAVGGVRGGRMG